MVPVNQHGNGCDPAKKGEIDAGGRRVRGGGKEFGSEQRLLSKVDVAAGGESPLEITEWGPGLCVREVGKTERVLGIDLMVFHDASIARGQIWKPRLVTVGGHVYDVTVGGITGVLARCVRELKWSAPVRHLYTDVKSGRVRFKENGGMWKRDYHEGMALVIEEEYLPATLTAGPMSDEEFEEICAKYPDYFIELTAEGEIVIMPPNYPYTSAQNLRIARQLGDWADSDRRGIATDSSGGFVLPSGARRSPDAAWVPKDRLRAMDRKNLKQKFWHLCPPFVIEVRSTWDRLPKLRKKMQEWIDNGAELAWLIDPERRVVEVYRPQQLPEILEGIESIAAGQPVEGFTLDLAPVWDPLA
jgi:Uma2 family endonuclease